MILKKAEDAWQLPPGELQLNPENVMPRRPGTRSKSPSGVPHMSRQRVCDAADFLLAHWEETDAPPIDFATRAQVCCSGLKCGVLRCDPECGQKDQARRDPCFVG